MCPYIECQKMIKAGDQAPKICSISAQHYPLTGREQGKARDLSRGIY